MQEKEQYSDSIDSKQFFKVVHQHKFIVAGIILCCTLITGIYTFLKPVEYRSEAVICLRNPGTTSMEENLQTIMLLKQNPELKGIELNYSKESSSIKVETNKKNAQETYDAVKKAIVCVQQDIKKQNSERELQDYPSLERAREEMNIALMEYEKQKQVLPESSVELQKSKDEYTSRSKVYENQLSARVGTLYAVQLIQAPNLPDKPEKIRHGNDILIGVLVGCLISFYYCLKQYKKKG